MRAIPWKFGASDVCLYAPLISFAVGCDDETIENPSQALFVWDRDKIATAVVSAATVLGSCPFS